MFCSVVVAPLAGNAADAIYRNQTHHYIHQPANKDPVLHGYLAMLKPLRKNYLTPPIPTPERKESFTRTSNSDTAQVDVTLVLESSKEKKEDLTVDPWKQANFYLPPPKTRQVACSNTLES
jgi:hypothetical protein